MPTVTSPDGTTIAFDRTGAGPALILVDGALCYRAAGPMTALVERLRDAFTVYTYDRRGRGDSTDTAPYAVAREVEDLQALIGVAGGEAHVYGISSGAALVLATAAAGPGVTRAVLYEPPFVGEADDDAKEYTARLHELLDAGHRGEAVAHFMTHVGVPPQAIDGIRAQPGWAMLEAIAPTLAYDDDILAGGGVPHDVAARVTIPALVLAGSASPEPLRRAARATADALPHSRHRTLDGETHDVSPAALAPALIAFLT